MNLLTRWNPLGKTSDLDVWRPTSRWDPLREMEEMMRNMQRTLATFPSRSGGEESSAIAREWSPCVDIGETDQEFIVKAELPDVKKEDIKVHIEDDTLIISGERKAESEEKNLKFHRVERSYGCFQRSFGLPEEADPEKITSEFKDGILTVHLPKNPEVKHSSHNIPVD